MAVLGSGEVMEENVSHEIIASVPNPYFPHVYRITTSETTSCLSPFLYPQLIVPFICPFFKKIGLSFPLCEMCSPVLFIDSIKVTCLLTTNSHGKLWKNSQAMPLQRDARFKTVSKKTNASI